MAKPITREMLEGMSLDQRKTLLKNAQQRDTAAAKDVIAMLEDGDLLTRAPAAVEAPVAAKRIKMRPAPKPAKEATDEESDEAEEV